MDSLLHNRMKKFCLAIVCTLLSIVYSYSQRVYFADGYHGGIYGHYPVEWKTRFIVDQFNNHPEWKISLEIEPETWDTVQVRTPEAYQDFKNIVTDKRVEFTNSTYAQPYCYNISGESIIRQFEYGIKKIHTHFPDVKFTTYSVEEPCFTSSLPQILKLFGYKYAVLKNPNTCWGGYVSAYGGELVDWIGPDSTSILTVPRYACEELEDNSTWQTKAWANSESYLKACFDSGIKHPAGMCFQDAGWNNGPWLGSGDNIKNNSIYITWKDYIENISVGKTTDNWHFTQENVLVNLMWGSQVLQKIAQEVRTSENKVIIAEKLGVIANLENNYQYNQDNLDDAWRTLMMAQHHDSWIVPYNGLNKYRTWAEEITLWTNHTNTISNDIIGQALQSFEQNGSGNKGYVRIYNTLGIHRKEVASIVLPVEYNGTDFELYNDRKKKVPYSIGSEGEKTSLFFLAEVPPFGYTTYYIQKKKSGKKNVSGIQFTKAGECILENDMYKIVLDISKGGTIKSLLAKKEGNKEFAVQLNGNALGELRGYFYEDEKYYSSSETSVKVTILKDNQLEKSVKIEGQIASHPFSQTITIAQGQRRIDFDLVIDWKKNVGIGEYKQADNWRDNRRAFCDDRFKLNVLFPVNLNSPVLYKNAPFDVCESKLDNTYFKAWDEIKHNVILNWVDLLEKDHAYGLALFSDHTTSYSYGEDFPLGLTAQYSGIGLWGPNYKITRPLKMKYALVPHRGKWDKAAISTESNCWNEPLVCSYHPFVEMGSKSLINIENTGYEISAAKILKDGILVRLFNAQGNNDIQRVEFGFPVSYLEEIDLNGTSIKKHAVKHVAGKSETEVSLPRFGLKTFFIKQANSR